MEEIREALPVVAGDLQAALDGFALETRTLVDADDSIAERVLKDEIGGFVRLTGGSWLPEHRREYMEQCLVEFATIPVHLLIPALAHARRTVFDPKRLVSWVFEYVERDMTRLQAEGEMLTKLAEIRGV